jgi:hypothetical protein
MPATGKSKIGHGAAFKKFKKIGCIEYLFESSDHPDSTQITSIDAGFRGFAGPTNLCKNVKSNYFRWNINYY